MPFNFFQRSNRIQNDTQHGKNHKTVWHKSNILSILGVSAGIAVVILSVALKFAAQNAPLLHFCDRFLDSLQETKYHLANNVFLNGNFAPVAEEHRGVALKVVEGALPYDLDGLFIRNGPNPIPSQITKRYHWFDGHGMLHKVRIKAHPQPSATYSNHFIPTPRYEIERKMGREVFSNIAEFKGVIGLIKALVMAAGLPKAFGLSSLEVGTANTHTLMYNKKFYCTHEGSLPFEVQLDYDGNVVNGVGYEDFHGVLDYPVSAHPKIDPVTGNFLFHGYTADPNLVNKYGPIKVGEYDSNQGKLLHYLGVQPDAKHASFAHDMAFTKNWVVVIESSVYFDPSSMFKKDEGFFSFQSDKPLRFGLVPRVGSHQENHTLTHLDVVWIDTDTPNSLVHPLTAWEENDGTVVIWSPIGDSFDANFDYNKSLMVLHMAEFRLDTETRQIVSKKVIDTQYNLEFPRVRDECLGRFCRFGYSGIITQSPGAVPIMSGFAVWDMKKKTLHKVVHYLIGEEAGQEPVLIPKPGRDESNAVYVATILYSVKNNQSYFVLYDGDGDNGLVAKLPIPYRVPFGFHGQWLTGDQLQAHVEHHTS